jgi:hypothetical protein
MLLKEEFERAYDGLSKVNSPEAFRRNVQYLMREHDLPKAHAIAVSYCLLDRVCMSEGKAKTAYRDVLKKMLLPDEEELAEGYRKLVEEEMSKEDPLKEMDEIDAIAQGTDEPEKPKGVEGVVGELETDLKKAVLVGLARMLRQLGYDKWPTEKAGQDRIAAVIDELSAALSQMGARFNSVMRGQLGVLKSKGPEKYEQIVSQWLSGQPEEIEGPKQDENIKFLSRGLAPDPETEVKAKKEKK